MLVALIIAGLLLGLTLLLMSCCCVAARADAAMHRMLLAEDGSNDERHRRRTACCRQRFLQKARKGSPRIPAEMGCLLYENENEETIKPQWKDQRVIHLRATRRTRCLPRWFV